MKKILITGATGFVGQHLCRFLQQKHYKIFGTYYPKDPISNLGYPLFSLDITDSKQVNALLSKIRPDWICHLAAKSVPKLSQNLSETFRINMLGTLNMLHATVRYRPQARFLFISSIQVYGDSFRGLKLINEKTLCKPVTPYAISKAIAELACRNIFQQFGLPVLIARSTNHVGSGMTQGLVFSDWCRQIINIERKIQAPTLETGNLHVKRDFLHIEDVLRAYECLLLKGQAGETYNVASGQTRRLADYVHFLKGLSRSKFKILIDPAKISKNDVPNMKISNRKLRSLGWTPQFDVFQALEQLLLSLRSSRNN